MHISEAENIIPSFAIRAKMEDDMHKGFFRHSGRYLAAGAVAALMPAAAAAEDASLGATLYTEACAVCHGASGTGNGEFAEHLKIPPSDLTVLTKNNHGEFPYLKVFQIVDGRTGVRGHGSGEMPIWGMVFSREVGAGAGPYGAELFIRAKVVSLVDYIETLQK